MLTTTWFSIRLIVHIAATVILTGFKKQPGIGIILIDTLGLTMIYFNQHNSLNKLLWKEKA
jgi:hypothetical protein